MNPSAFIAALCLVSGGAAPAPPPEREVPTTPVMRGKTTAPAVRGTWRSRGYGWLLTVSERGLRLHHETAAGCVADPGDTAALLERFGFSQPGPEGGAWFLGQPGETRYRFDRIARLPAACAKGRARDAPAVFEAFAALFSEHYPFFDTRRFDWPARVREARAQVSRGMSERALFDVLAGMLRGLGDSHVGLTAKVGTETLRHDESTSRTLALLSERARAEGRPARDVEREWLRAYRDGILQRVLGGGGRQAANGRILWGFARPGIGYLNVLTMGGFVADGSPREELAALDATLDEALAAFAGADAVIVDVSNNRGGHDLLARAIASRFADQPRHAYTKRAHRADGVPPQPFQVEPSSRRRFTGRVYLVTSDVTVSAGEIFTLAMRALPNVTHAGTSTRGALSDMLEKPLPNGWTVELSNEVYLDPAGEAFEGRGIPPAEAFEPFPRDDLSNGHAVALGRLAERLAAAAAPSR